MAFQGYLDGHELNEAIQAAIDSDLVTIDRSLLMVNIPKSFVLGLRQGNNPLDQFQLDLIRINSIERMENGLVPITQYLENAAFQLKLRGRTEGKIFAQLQNIAGNRASGLPSLPKTSDLPEITKKEAIIGFNDIVDFPFLADGAKAGRSVAKLLVPRFENGQAVNDARGGPWVSSGTAWLIAPTLMITNHHVVNARRSGEPDAILTDFQRQGRESVVVFDYDTGADPVKYAIDSVVSFDPTLDYAIFRLGNDPKRLPLGIMPQRLVVDSTTHVSLNIIQHPQGLLKRVAFRNNLVSGADADTVRYFTDTDSGSSGSPVCDDDWHVVALHRGAVQVSDVNYQGKSTAFVNFGSQIQSIIERVKEKSPSIYDEINRAHSN